MIDLPKLRHAVAVAREGSFSAAAEFVHISQPALSRSIQMLEARYGVVLFERGRSGARLTLQGAEFIEVAEDLLRRAASVDEQLQLVGHGRSAEVSFGIGSASAASFLPDILAAVIKHDVRLRIRISANGALELLLRHGEIDFFVGGMHRGESLNASAHGFVVRELPGIHVGLLVRQGHPLLAEEPTSAALSRFPVLAGAFVRDALSPLTLDRMGLQVPSIQLDDYGILASVARQSDHILISSEVLPHVRPELGLTSLPVRLTSEDLPRLALVTSARTALPAATQRVIGIVADQVSRLAAICAKT